MSSITTQNLEFVLPVPGDPSNENLWGYSLNTTFQLIDTALAGVQDLSIGSASVVRLQCTAGAADETRAAVYVLSGALTQNITILFPQNLSRKFAVNNACTGNYTVTLGADNGSGSSAGATETILQGVVGEFYSDGVNVYSTTTATAPLNGETVVTLGSSSPVQLTQQQASGGNIAFSGAITENIIVLWPVGFDANNIAVSNSTSGNYTVTIGISNGAGGSVGQTQIIAQGGQNDYVFNTNGVFTAVNQIGIGLPQGPTGVSIGGNSNVSLTLPQSQGALVRMTGALTANIDVFWPQGFVGLVAIYNGSSGAYTATVGVSNGSGSFAGTSLVVPQGALGLYYFDGTNIAGMNLLGLGQTTSDLQAKAQATISGGTWTAENCSITGSGGTYSVTMNSGYTFANGTITYGFYDGSKPMTAAVTGNISGTNPTFTVVTYNSSGSIAAPSTGGFQVIGK